MPDIFEKLLKEHQQTNLYLKLIATKVHSIEAELVNTRLLKDREALHNTYTVKPDGGE